MATVMEKSARLKPLTTDGYKKLLVIAAHRGQVRGMVTGALLIAGFFTFPFGRLLGSWLFG